MTYPPDDRDYYTISTGVLHKYEIPVISEVDMGFTTKKKQNYNKKILLNEEY